MIIRLTRFISEDIRILAALLLVACGLWAFIEIAGAVTAGGTAALDEKILMMMRSAEDLSDPVGEKWLEEMMRDITGLGGVGILSFFTLMTCLYLVLINKPRVALYVLLAIVLGTIFSFALKYGFERPRPNLVPHGSYVYTHSFPSGHSLMSAMVYYTLAGLLSRTLHRRRLKSFLFIVASILTVSIGISRVYMGVHWPSDVLAGWAAGLLWAGLTLLIAVILKQKGFFSPAGPGKAQLS